MTVSDQHDHNIILQILGNRFRHGVLPYGLSGIEIFKFNLAPEVVLVVIKNILKVVTMGRLGGIYLLWEVFFFVFS